MLYDVRQFATGDGSGCSVVRPSLQEATRQASGATAGTFDAWGSWVPVPGSPDTYFDEYRIVSYGVRVWSVTSPTNSSGTVSLFTQTGDIETSIPYGSYFYTDVTRSMLYDYQSTWVGKPLGNAAMLYHSLATTDVPGWSELAIAYRGATPGDLSINLTYEVVYNCELLCDPQSLFTRASTTASPHVPHIEELTDDTITKIPHSIEGPYHKASETIMQIAMETVEAFVASAAPQAIEYLVGLL
jgi:hypothetical protein